ncbi:MAG TPA: hypothetical protein VG709_02545 [Actinomycetota bacterium]|nr:hypothetical protein [Actinomycetota bacterium]
MAGKHEPESSSSFYGSLARTMATGTLRILLVAAALAIGVFVLANVFPDGAATSRILSVPVAMVLASDP